MLLLLEYGMWVALLRGGRLQGRRRRRSFLRIDSIWLNFYLQKAYFSPSVRVTRHFGHCHLSYIEKKSDHKYMQIFTDVPVGGHEDVVAGPSCRRAHRTWSAGSCRRCRWDRTTSRRQWRRRRPWSRSGRRSMMLVGDKRRKRRHRSRSWKGDGGMLCRHLIDRESSRCYK